MRNKYNIEQVFADVLRIKGLVYPGFLLDKAKGLYTPDGAPLRKAGADGRWYFMPVWLDDVEIPHAVVSMTGQKTIVETPLIGRQGTVKELISMQDYTISIAGVLVGDDYPADAVKALTVLYKRAESVEIVSALTDSVLGQKDVNNPHMVVLTNITWSEVGAVENMQAFRLTAKTDRPFNLYVNMQPNK